MTTTLLKFAGAAATALMMAACATGPDLEAGNGATTGTAAPTGPIPGSMADFEKNAGNRVFFAYDQYTLSSEAQSTLSRQAAWLREYPQSAVLIAGNCDERGTREYNLALGARRAEAARAYLVSLGVDPTRIQTVSYGKERPIDARSTQQAWALNRNATTALTNVGS
ncbi:MAG: peptidoglycan-associated lipoprotein Pal [Pseudomonadota bacterium]